MQEQRPKSTTTANPRKATTRGRGQGCESRGESDPMKEMEGRSIKTSCRPALIRFYRDRLNRFSADLNGHGTSTGLLIESRSVALNLFNGKLNLPLTPFAFGNRNSSLGLSGLALDDVIFGDPGVGIYPEMLSIQWIELCHGSSVKRQQSNLTLYRAGFSLAGYCGT